MVSIIDTSRVRAAAGTPTAAAHRGAFDGRPERRPVFSQWQPTGWGDARRDDDLDRRRHHAYHQHWRPLLLSPSPHAGRFAPRWARSLFADEIAHASARGRAYGHAL